MEEGAWGLLFPSSFLEMLEGGLGSRKSLGVCNDSLPSYPFLSFFPMNTSRTISRVFPPFLSSTLLMLRQKEKAKTGATGILPLLDTFSIILSQVSLGTGQRQSQQSEGHPQACVSQTVCVEYRVQVSSLQIESVPFSCSLLGEGKDSSIPEVSCGSHSIFMPNSATRNFLQYLWIAWVQRIYTKYKTKASFQRCYSLIEKIKYTQEFSAQEDPEHKPWFLSFCHLHCSYHYTSKIEPELILLSPSANLLPWSMRSISSAWTAGLPNQSPLLPVVIFIQFNHVTLLLKIPELLL